jgi:hypothetical protein
MKKFHPGHPAHLYGVTLECLDSVVPFLALNPQTHKRKPLKTNLMAYITYSTKNWNVSWQENDRKEVYMVVGSKPLKPGAQLIVRPPPQTDSEGDDTPMGDSGAESE